MIKKGRDGCVAEIETESLPLGEGEERKKKYLLFSLQYINSNGGFSGKHCCQIGTIMQASGHRPT